MTREPAAIIGTIVGVIEAIVVALVTAGAIPIDSDALAEVVAAIVAVGAAVQAVWTRSRVYAPATVERYLEE